jgi:hypothetical protein
MPAGIAAGVADHRGASWREAGVTLPTFRACLPMSLKLFAHLYVSIERNVCGAWFGRMAGDLSHWFLRRFFGTT